VNAIAEFRGEYHFLSNFYPSPMTPPTLEHHYAALKCADVADSAKVFACKTAGGAKQMARKMKLAPEWDLRKVVVMEDLIRIKFRDHALREQLRATAPRQLIEGNWWHDNFWGACWCLKCADKPKQNTLGKLLMKIRSECMEELQNEA